MKKLRETRDDVADKRQSAGAVRDDIADKRDLAGDERDLTGDARDEVAGLRDAAAEQRDRAAEEFDALDRVGSPDRVLRSELARREASSDREAASLDRSASEHDRAGSQLDRRVATNNRRSASLRRKVDRHEASIDTLTGVVRRDAGFMALDRDIARARRTEKPLVVGFIDVDHLKLVNDRQGHAAGDQMLRNVVNVMRSNLRASDLIFRYGGDEFVCVLLDSDIGFGELRLAQVNEELARSPSPSSVTAGFAELRSEDSSESLLARADAELYRKRKLR